MIDPEFRAYYILSREKARIELFMEKLKEDILKDADKKNVISDLNKITKYIRHIAL